MSTKHDPIEENEEFETAKKWLKANGTFTTSIIETKVNVGINVETEKVTYKITFQKNNSSKTETLTGEDLKKLTLDMYNSES
jgi:hypothetical protein